MDQKNSNTTMIVMIAVIALGALAIAWSAFNRSVQDLTPTVAEETNEAAQMVEQETEEAARAVAREAEEWERSAELVAARAEAEAELLALQARVEAGEEIAELDAELEAIERDLEVAYANAEAEAQEEWNDIQAGFTELEQGVRNGTADTLNLFAGLTAMLAADVRVDSDTDWEIEGSVD